MTSCVWTRGLCSQPAWAWHSVPEPFPACSYQLLHEISAEQARIQEKMKKKKKVQRAEPCQLTPVTPVTLAHHGPTPPRLKEEQAPSLRGWRWEG